MRLEPRTPERLDRFLALELSEHSRSRLSKLIADGGVRVDGVLRKASFRVEPGMLVEVEAVPPSSPHDLEPADIPLDVVYEDSALLVVNKPRGLSTHPAPSSKAPTLVNALLHRGQALSAGSAPFRPGIVHRLDKETSGLIVVAKTDAAHRILARQFAGKVAERRYVAVVEGEVREPSAILDGPIGRDPRDRTRMAVVPEGKSARTHVRRLGSAPEGTVLALKLETGRTHQIRVHLAACGHPVVGDRIYGSGAGALQLHAAYLSFEDPGTGMRRRFTVPPPADFRAPVDLALLENWA